MTLIALCSLKGSPGVTTAAVGLAARWPRGEQPVVVECDPAGGDLVARFRLETSPSLVSLAAAARRAADPGLIWQHAQRLPGGLPVVVGPVGAVQAHAALGQLAVQHPSVLRRAADRTGTVVVADCGRADPHSPALPVMRAADAVLLFARARDDSLAHTAATLDTAARWSRRSYFVLVGGGYPTDEVAQVLGIEVLGRMPDDSKGAAALSGHTGPLAAPARSSLGRATADLAQRVSRSARTEPAVRAQQRAPGYTPPAGLVTQPAACRSPLTEASNGAQP